jgi:hypothetical protein
MCSHSPNFCQNGKENITVGQIFAHMACLMYFPEPVYDSKNITAVDLLIETSTPNCVLYPLSDVGRVATYHVTSWAFLTDYAIRKIDGRNVEQLMNEEIFANLPRSELIVSPGPEYTNRIAKLVAADGGALFVDFLNLFCTYAAYGEPYNTGCKALSLIPKLTNPLSSNNESVRASLYAPGDSEYFTPVTMAKLYGALAHEGSFTQLGISPSVMK